MNKMLAVFVLVAMSCGFALRLEAGPLAGVKIRCLELLALPEKKFI